MSGKRHPILNSARVVGIVAGMAVLVFVFGELVRDNRHDHYPDHEASHSFATDALHDVERTGPAGRPVTFSAPLKPAERSDLAVRDLATYYGRRVYAGSPPVIPHEVDPETERTQGCNACHETGGFVPRFNAYAPLTPHPEYENCLQCHAKAVPAVAPFVASQWESVRAPRLQRAALPGSPPPIPHTLQLRENCRACHAGPSVPLEIRTTHPERLNCVQCHAERRGSGVYVRPALAEGAGR